MRTEKFKKEDILKAIRQNFGNVSAAARKLGCSRTTIMNYVKRYKCCRTALQEQRESMVDDAETGLRTAVLNQEDWAIKFVLMNLGKDRGYGIEKFEHEHSGMVAAPTTFAEWLRFEKNGKMDKT